MLWIICPVFKTLNALSKFHNVRKSIVRMYDIQLFFLNHSDTLDMVVGSKSKELLSALERIRKNKLTYTSFIKGLDAGLIGNSGWAGFSKVVGIDITKIGPEKARRVMTYVNKFVARH